MLKTSVIGSDGKPIELNDQEAARAMRLQLQFNKEHRNDMGFDLPITTLTAISKSIVEQTFYTVPPALYMPLRVGENAWSDQIMTYVSFDLSGDFESGNLNTGSNNTRLAEADAGISSVYNKVIDWGKKITWSLVDLRKSARAGNWDLIASKEKARKTNWDLGIQKVAFLGSIKNPTAVMGLLTQAAVNSNTSLITGYIKAMNAAAFSTFVQGVIAAYRLNCNYTVMPTHFIIPETDYNGLGTLVPGTAGTFPITMLEYLRQAFVLITQNPNFKIMKLAYADKAVNVLAINGGLNKNRYTLLNYNEDSLRMDIPVDYTNTMQGSFNNFQFENVGYGEYTGVLAFRPLEMLYFDW
jgi:hypothetical protein